MSPNESLHERVVALMRRHDVAFTVDGDGGYLAEFVGGDFPPLVVRLAISAGQALSFRAFLVCLYSADWAPSLLVLLNRWHASERWPRGFIALDEDSRGAPPELAVFADHHLQAGAASDSQLDRWWWSFVAAADEMLTAVHLAAPENPQGPALPSADELDAWLNAE